MVTAASDIIVDSSIWTNREGPVISEANAIVVAVAKATPSQA